MGIDNHPLRYSTLVQTIERVLTTRLHHKKLDGYTLETAIQIADSIVGVTPERDPERDGVRELFGSDGPNYTLAHR